MWMILSETQRRCITERRIIRSGFAKAWQSRVVRACSIRFECSGFLPAGHGLTSLAKRIQRTPTQADWQRLSRSWQPLLDARIAALTQLRDQLSACIGCGCLSMQKCKLYNPGDSAAGLGAGARYLMGDRAVSKL